MPFYNIRLLPVFIILLCSMAKAQTCELSLRGHLRDEDNSEDLGFAVLRLEPGNVIKQTNERGDFVFTALCPGSYTLMVRHAGCRDTVLVLDIRSSRKINILLPHSLNELQDVDVAVKHQDARTTQSSASLDKKDLDKVMGQSLGEQLKQLNGVTSINAGPTISKPMINGMTGYRVLTLNNGVRQEGQQWGNEHAPEIDPFTASQLTVLRGASAVRYGSDAIGGVILVEPAELPDSAGISGEFQASGNSNGRGGAASGMLQGSFTKLPRLGWRIQGTLRKSGNIRTPGYYLDNTGTDEKNFSAAAGWHGRKAGISLYYAQFNAKAGIFSGAHVGNLSDLLAAFNSSKPQDSLAGFSYELDRPYQNIAHELMKVNADVHTGPRSRIRILLASQYNLRQEYDKHTSRNVLLAAQNLPEGDFRISTQNAELMWEHDYIRSFRGRFGVQGMMQQNRYLQKFFIPNYNSQSFGVFAIERYVQRKLEVEAGIRQDYKQLQSWFYKNGELQSPRLSFNNTSLNAGFLYRISNRVNMSMNAGTAWRAPAPNELYSDGLHHGIGAIERGDAGLKKEQCLSAIALLSYQAKKIQAEFNIYNYEFSNYIYYQPDNAPELTIRGAFPVFNYAQCRARISGGDAQARWQFSRTISLRLRAMMVRGRDLDKNQYLIYMPADRAEMNLSVNLRDRARIKNLFLEPGLQLVNKQWRVPAGMDFVPPPAAYVLAGLNAGCSFFLGSQEVITMFSISNAANSVYRDYLDRFRYYNDAAGVNYSLKIRIPFNISHPQKQNSNENK